MDRFITAEPFPPGEYIQDEIDARGWSQEDLAQVLKMTRRQITNLIAGDAAITPDTAVALGQAFGQDPTTWMNLQVSYELAIAAKKDRGVAKRAALFSKVPIREAKKRCWLPDTDDEDQLERAVCKLLRIPTFDTTPSFPVAARKGTNYAYDTAAQIAWFGRAYQLAEGAPAGTYADSNFESGVRDLLTLAENPADARKIPSLLGEIGIRLVLLEHLKGTRIDGVAFWLDEKSPAIALSMRYDRIDNLWFNLLHEMVHIKYRHQNAVIDVEPEEGATEELPENEVIANSEAADYLVSRAKLDSFIRRTAPYFYLERIVQFARAQKVHPGIVVGQLHKRKVLKPFQLRKRNVLVEVRQHILGQAVTDGWGNDIWLDE